MGGGFARLRRAEMGPASGALPLRRQTTTPSRWNKQKNQPREKKTLRRRLRVKILLTKKKKTRVTKYLTQKKKRHLPILRFSFSTRTSTTKGTYTGFYWVLLGFSDYYRNLPKAIGFYQVLLLFYFIWLSFTGFYWDLTGSTGFYWVVLDFTWILPVFTGFYPFLLDFIGIYCVLPGVSGFYWVLSGFTGLYRVLLGFTGLYLFNRLFFYTRHYYEKVIGSQTELIDGADQTVLHPSTHPPLSLSLSLFIKREQGPRREDFLPRCSG